MTRNFGINAAAMVKRTHFHVDIENIHKYLNERVLTLCINESEKIEALASLILQAEVWKTFLK